MILKEFALFLQEHNTELLTHQTTPLDLLPIWVNQVLTKTPKTHIDKILSKEVMFCKNKQGDCMIIGKSDSGRVLVNALIKFAKSYQNYTHSKWLDMTEKNLYKKDEQD